MNRKRIPYLNSDRHWEHYWNDITDTVPMPKYLGGTHISRIADTLKYQPKKEWIRNGRVGLLFKITTNNGLLIDSPMLTDIPESTQQIQDFINFMGQFTI